MAHYILDRMIALFGTNVNIDAIRPSSFSTTIDQRPKWGWIEDDYQMLTPNHDIVNLLESVLHENNFVFNGHNYLLGET